MRDQKPESAHSSAVHRERSKSKAIVPRRRRWWVASMAIVLVVLLLPNLIGWTGTHQWLINWACASLPGKVQIEKLSCGWFQPIRLSGVTIEDDSGEPLLTLDSLVSDRSLVAWIRGTDLGSLEVRQPRLNLVLEPQGSNLESFIQRCLEAFPADPNSETPLPDVQVNIVDGKTLIRPADPQAQQWMVDKVQGAVRLGAPAAPLLLELGLVEEKEMG